MAVSELNVFGRIVTAATVEQGVIALLQKWFPTYLREVERQNGWQYEPLENPRSYNTTTSFDFDPGERIPKAVVISPGLYAVPTKGDAGNFYNAAWQIAVGIAFVARTRELAEMETKMYGAAVRAILVQHQDIEMPETVVEVTWLDESYDDLQLPDMVELLKVSANLFAVHVENAVTRWAGPLVPDESEQLYGEVETADATIIKVPLDADV